MVYGLELLQVKKYVFKKRGADTNEVVYESISASDVKAGDKILTVDGIATVVSVEQQISGLTTLYL